MSGLRWNTYPYWNDEAKACHRRALLINPTTRKLVDALVNSYMAGTDGDLPDLKKATISDALACIYHYAAENVKLCRDMDPIQYFAAAKASVHFARYIQDDTMWRFTYKLIHARNLFKDSQPGWKQSQGHDLVHFLDAYCDAFYNEYDPGYGLDFLKLPKCLQDETKLAEITLKRAENLRVVAQYFPQQLTCAEYHGDGEDRIFVIARPPVPEKDELSELLEDIHLDEQSLFLEDGEVNPYFDWSNPNDAKPNPDDANAEDEFSMNLREQELEDRMESMDIDEL